MQVTAVLPHLVPKSVGTNGDLGHFWLSDYHTGGCIWVAKYDFLLATPIVTLGLGKTVVELQVSRTTTDEPSKKNVAGYLQSRFG